MIRKLAYAAATAAAALTMSAGTAQAAQAPKPVWRGDTLVISHLCHNEDGSDKRDADGCLWDASSEGNGVGWSFVVLPRGEYGEAYAYVTRTPKVLNKTHPLGVLLDDSTLEWNNALIASVYYGRQLYGRGFVPLVD